ncbi:Bug family tripartite tricarboxylate transporter substrate binding protein [Paracoccus laeviglucosivorans]|nr:tripartite tricarboxylate transporter substrate binding protein [Paracoccus laeviglucosivorans]
MLKTKLLPRLLAAAGLTLVAGLAQAQDWRPSDTVRLIVPSSPGGGHDTNARALSAVMEKYAGQTIVVENQPGGGGVVAYNQMAGAKPDGLTLGQVSTALVTDRYRLDNVKYGADSFRYVGEISADPNLLVVSAKGPYADMPLSQFLENAKANPETVLMGVSGNWGNQDYVRYALEKETGAKFRRIPVKGGRNILLGILGGDIGAGLLYPSEVKAQIDAGELKVLAHNGAGPVAGIDGVQSFADQGVNVGLSVWRVLALPKDTPDDVFNGWQEILRQTMEDPELRKGYEAVAVGYAYSDGTGAEAVVRKADEELGAISREAGIVKE